MSFWRRVVLCVALVALALPARAACPGDCDGGGTVAINELIVGVNIALGNSALSECAAIDQNGNGGAEINELIRAVGSALNGCPVEPIFPADYRNTFVEVRGCRNGIEHGATIRVFANDVAARAYLENASALPVGSIVVKEEFEGTDCDRDNELIRWRAMRKEAPGFDPEDGDWHWQWVNPDRSVRFDDKRTCIGCHRAAECVARDYMCTEAGDEPTPTPTVRPGLPTLRVVTERLPAALLSVAGTSATDVYAVGGDPGDGKGPLALHYDGSAWQRLETGASGALWWVADPPIEGEPYFAGDNGQVLRYRPASRTFEALPTQRTETLFGIWGTDRSHIWAVGGDSSNPETTGVLLFHDGTRWSVEDLSALLPGGVPALFKVWGRNASDVYVVGFRGVMLHYDGTRWESLSSATTRALLTVHGNSSTVAAVGGAVSGVIVERAGNGAFADRTPASLAEMNGVYLREDGLGIAVGLEGATALRTPGGWSRGAFVDTAELLSFHAAWIDPSGGVWAVGGDLDSLDAGVLAYGGPRVVPAPVP